MTEKSRFGALLEAKNRGAEVPEAPAPEAPLPSGDEGGIRSTFVDRSAEAPAPEQPLPSPASKRGRPPGKKSKSRAVEGKAGEYVQTTAYITTSTHGRAGMALIQEGLQQGRKPREWSELVQDLLDAWLAARPTV